MQSFPEFMLPSHLASVNVEEGGRVDMALRLASAASRVTLRYFRTDEYQVERKSDRSPVTLADKEAEQRVRTMLSEAFPDDGILGEEYGTVPGSSLYQWIIDPIDGTKSFISGVPLYSTLIGLTRRGEPLVGVIAIPALGELAIGVLGHGTWHGQGAGAKEEAIALKPARVSRVNDLREGLFLVSQIDNFEKRQAEAAYKSLEREAYITRSWGDGYGYLLVATGRAELMVDPIVNPWDVAAVAPVIKEAGGQFSSWSGAYDIHAGHCLASNGHVHDFALTILQPYGS
jgi:histidinol phosphatase-like enzyme (inositol monophosphatase family)